MIIFCLKLYLILKFGSTNWHCCVFVDEQESFVPAGDFCCFPTVQSSMGAARCFKFVSEWPRKYIQNS